MGCNDFMQCLYFCPDKFGNNTISDIKCTFFIHIPHMPTRAMQCNVISYRHLPTCTWQFQHKQSNLIFSLSFYEWVFMFMYLKINIVAYWVLLIQSIKHFFFLNKMKSFSPQQVQQTLLWRQGTRWLSAEGNYAPTAHSGGVTGL